MVGPSGSGKSTASRVLLKALERFEGVEGVAHIIDPKGLILICIYLYNKYSIILTITNNIVLINKNILLSHFKLLAKKLYMVF